MALFALGLIFIKPRSYNKTEIPSVDIRECKLLKGKMECERRALAKGVTDEASYYLKENL